MNSARVETLRRRIGRLTWLFIAGLVLRGATAIPLESELDAVVRMLGVRGNARPTPALPQERGKHAQFPGLFTPFGCFVGTHIIRAMSWPSLSNA